MAIQMRRGLLANYDEDKMTSGELAVTTDATTEDQQIFVAFAAGTSKRVLTETDMTDLNLSLDEKADIASPALTGTPTAPTATTGTNTTQIATTAFVQTAVGSIPSTLTASGDGTVTLSLT